MEIRKKNKFGLERSLAYHVECDGQGRNTTNTHLGNVLGAAE